MTESVEADRQESLPRNSRGKYLSYLSWILSSGPGVYWEIILYQRASKEIPVMPAYPLCLTVTPMIISNLLIFLLLYILYIGDWEIMGVYCWGHYYISNPVISDSCQELLIKILLSNTWGSCRDLLGILLCIRLAFACYAVISINNLYTCFFLIFLYQYLIWDCWGDIAGLCPRMPVSPRLYQHTYLACTSRVSSINYHREVHICVQMCVV